MFTFGARAAQSDESALHALGDFTANASLLLLSSQRRGSRDFQSWNAATVNGSWE